MQDPKDVKAPCSIGNRLGFDAERLSRLRQTVLEKEKSASQQILENKLKREQKQQNLKGRDGPDWRVLRSLEGFWRKEFSARFPDILQSKKWAQKEKGQTRKLLTAYDIQAVMDAIEYLIRYWDKIKARISRITGSFPTVGILLAYHDTLVPEAHKLKTFIKTVNDYEALRREKGYHAIPPELQEAYAKAKKMLQEFGLG